MKKYLLFIYLTLFLICGGSPALFADQKSDLDTYFKFFNKDYTPTLEDYFRFHSDESYEFQEEVLEEMVCRQKGLIPSEKYDAQNACTKYQIARRNNEAKEPSFYLAWLRTKLPSSPRITNLKMKTIHRKEDSWTYTEIHCKFNEVSLVLDYSIEAEGDKATIDVEKINGKSVDAMFEKYTQDSNRKVSKN